MPAINYSLELCTDLWDKLPHLRETSQLCVGIWQRPRRPFSSSGENGHHSEGQPHFHAEKTLLSFLTEINYQYLPLGLPGYVGIFLRAEGQGTKPRFFYYYYFCLVLWVSFFQIKPLVFHTWQDELDSEKRSQNLISIVIQCMWSETIIQRSIWKSRLGSPLGCENTWIRRILKPASNYQFQMLPFKKI